MSRLKKLKFQGLQSCCIKAKPSHTTVTTINPVLLVTCHTHTPKFARLRRSLWGPSVGHTNVVPIYTPGQRVLKPCN